MNIILIFLAILWLASGLYMYFYILDPEIEKKNTFLMFIVFLLLTPPLVLYSVLRNGSR